MKRNLYIIVGVILAIVATMLAGNVITIGERLAHLHPWAEYGFYLLVLLLAVVYIVRPIWRVHHAPEFPHLSADDAADAPALRDFGLRLASGCLYLPEERRSAHQMELRRQIDEYAADATELRAIVARELKLRLDGDAEMGVRGINGRIRQWATTVFMVTAVSQSAKFDSLSVMYFNYKMIEDIILASGFRPTSRQLFRQYVRILTTSLITYYANEVLSDMNDLTPFASASDQAADTGSWTFMGALRKLTISGLVAGSVLDGAVNALLTLRIGYVTRAYLVEGSRALATTEAKRNVRRRALADAMKAIPSVVAAGSASLGKGVAATLRRLFTDDGEEADRNVGNQDVY